MYIVELILGKFKKKKEVPPPAEQKDYEACEHVFMPVDSTGEMLACMNCGLLINKDRASSAR